MSTSSGPTLSVPESAIANADDLAQMAWADAQELNNGNI